MADLDIFHASGSVKIAGADRDTGQETSFAETTNGSLKVNLRDANGNAISETNRLPTTDVLNIGIATSEKTATSTASVVRVGAANFVGRKAIEVVNTSTVVIYIGNSTVSVSGTTRGRPIDPKSSFAIDLAANVDLYIIAASNATYVVTEVG